VPAPSSQIARHILVLGRVQGVGYRRWLADEAEAMGLAGWVRNRRDGAVEALVIGMPAGVEALIAAARHGPALAMVTHIEISEHAVPANLDGFAIRPTE